MSRERRGPPYEGRTVRPLPRRVETGSRAVSGVDAAAITPCKRGTQRATHAGTMQLLHHPVTPQPRDLCRPEPEPAQHLLRVLAEAGGGRADRRRRVGELDRRPGYYALALPYHPRAVARRRGGARLLQRVGRAGAGPPLPRARSPLGVR